MFGHRAITACMMVCALGVGVAAAAPPSGPPVNTHRFDPYKSYRFLVLIDGRVVAGFGGAGPVAPKDDVVEYRAGGETTGARKLPGRMKYEAITLARGLTQDSGFAAWASQASAAPTSLRKDVFLESVDATGRVTGRQSLSRCWTSRYRGLPKLGGSGADVAIEALELTCESVELAP